MSDPKTSNGRKIARIAPIWTKLGRNRSQRLKLDFQKFFRDPVVQKLRENCENFRETVVGRFSERLSIWEGYLFKGDVNDINSLPFNIIREMAITPPQIMATNLSMALAEAGCESLFRDFGLHGP